MDSNLKDSVYMSIRTDIELRNKIAKQLSITESSVYRYAFRKSPSLKKKAVLDVLKKELKVELVELFEN